MKHYWLSAVMFIMSMGAVHAREPFVHVSLAKENRIVTYRLSGDGETLTLVDSVPVAGQPGPLPFHPTLPIIYADIRSVGNLSRLRVNESTGKRTSINETTAGDDPA